MSDRFIIKTTHIHTRHTSHVTCHMSDTFAKIVENPLYFEQLPDSEKTADLALIVVTTDPELLRIIPNIYQTYVVCKAALKRNPLVLKYIFLLRKILDQILLDLM